METKWQVDGASITLREGMVSEVGGRLLAPTLLVRRLTVEGRANDITIVFDPRYGAQHLRPQVDRRGED
jgi:hypothetical protein